MFPPTGITEAFKADSFDKKINLGNDARPPPPSSSCRHQFRQKQ